MSVVSCRFATSDAVTESTRATVEARVAEEYAVPHRVAS